MSNKMAIIGNGDSILAFSAVGVDAYPVENAETASNMLKKLAKIYGIIFITDTIASQIDEVIKRYNETAYPIILPIPSGKDSNGYGMKNIKDAMEKALGVDILFNNKD